VYKGNVSLPETDGEQAESEAEGFPENERGSGGRMARNHRPPGGSGSGNKPIRHRPRTAGRQQNKLKDIETTIRGWTQVLESLGDLSRVGVHQLVYFLIVVLGLAEVVKLVIQAIRSTGGNG